MTEEASGSGWIDVAPDALFRVTMRTAEDGGMGRTLRGPYVGFPLLIDDGRGYANDCRLILDGTTLEPGVSKIVPVVFLVADDALSRIRVGATYQLWPGRPVGEATVLAMRGEGAELPTLRQSLAESDSE